MFVTAPAVGEMEQSISTLRDEIASAKETIAEKEALIGKHNPRLFLTLQVVIKSQSKQPTNSTVLHPAGHTLLPEQLPRRKHTRLRACILYLSFVKREADRGAFNLPAMGRRFPPRFSCRCPSSCRSWQTSG